MCVLIVVSYYFGLNGDHTRGGGGANVYVTQQHTYRYHIACEEGPLREEMG